MNRLLVFLIVIITFWSAGHAHAQTILKVPFGSAQFGWDSPVPGPDQGVPDHHVLTCGGHSVTVPMPTTSIFIKDVVPGPGTYECVLYSENDFGRQAEPDVPFPTFQAGNKPVPGTNLRLQVQ